MCEHFKCLWLQNAVLYQTTKNAHQITQLSFERHVAGVRAAMATLLSICLPQHLTKKKKMRTRRRQSQPQTRIRAQVLHLLSENQKKQAMSTNAIPFFILKMFAFLL